MSPHTICCTHRQWYHRLAVATPSVAGNCVLIRVSICRFKVEFSFSKSVARTRRLEFSFCKLTSFALAACLALSATSLFRITRAVFLSTLSALSLRRSEVEEFVGVMVCLGRVRERLERLNKSRRRRRAAGLRSGGI